MDINQRDVYLLPHPWDSTVERHPFIVLSVKDANAHENCFLAVMITSAPGRFDDYSFQLTNDMFEKPLAKLNCHVRMHLMMMAFGEEIDSRTPINRMKPQYFKQLMADIGELIFNYNFTPSVL